MDPTLLKNLLLLVRLSVVAVSLLAGYLALYYLLPYLFNILRLLPVYLLPFIIALFLAILIEPLNKKIQRRLRVGRGASVLLSLLIIWGSLSLVATLVVGRLVAELIELYRYLSTYSGRLSADLVAAAERLQNLYFNLNLPPQVREGLEQNLGGAVVGAQKVVQASVNLLIGFLGALPGVFILLLIATIATFFISRDKQLITDTLFSWMPPDWFRKLRLILNDLGSALAGFLKAMLILITITGLITYLGLSLLGSEYALTVSLLTGLLDILPVLGPGLVLVPWSLWMLASGEFAFGCGLIILYGIIVFIRQLAEPKIMAQNIGLHPLATMLGMYVGLQLGGGLGMVLGPALLVLFQDLRRAGLITFWPIRPE